MILHERFCEKLQRAIELSGETQTSLGKKLGKSPQYVHNYMKGHHAKPALDIVEAFALALGLPPDGLINDVPVEEYLSAHV